MTWVCVVIGMGDLAFLIDRERSRGKSCGAKGGILLAHVKGVDS